MKSRKLEHICAFLKPAPHEVVGFFLTGMFISPLAGMTADLIWDNPYITGFAALSPQIFIYAVSRGIEAGFTGERNKKLYRRIKTHWYNVPDDYVH